MGICDAGGKDLNEGEAMQAFESLLQLLLMLVMDLRIDALLLLLLTAAVTDYRSFRIPNWLTLGGILFALVSAPFFTGRPWEALGWAVCGLLIGFFALLPFYAVGVMGAGDVKLMAMVGAFIGVPGIVYAVLATFIVGGVLAIAVILRRGVFSRALGNIRMLMQTLALSAFGGIRPDVQMDSRKSVGKLPYGISIGLGTAGVVVARQLGYL